MTHPQSISIADYTYLLPENKIALHPLPQRDASKLLIYKDGKLTDEVFHQLPKYLPKDSLLIFNNTRVVPARLLFQKPTGGTIEIFALEPVASGEITAAMAQPGSIEYLCLVKGVAKWKSGKLSQIKTTEANTLQFDAEMLSRENDAFRIRFTWQPLELSFAEVLQFFGEMPIPPYLHRAAEADDAERYQTIYAVNNGSVATPTAGLHFTDGVMQSLQAHNIEVAYTTLHVGAGTFKPVKSETLEGHDMHAEWISVEQTLIEKLLHSDSVIPVGTTSTRTLESLYWLGLKTFLNPDITLQQLQIDQWEVYAEDLPDIGKEETLNSLLNWMRKNNLSQLVTQTRILIAPGYRFRICKGIITNFHQPQSTLLLLIAALIRENWKNVYNHALNNDYRFLSYGDSSLLMSNES